MGALSDFFQSASNTAASNVSAPIDGISWLLRKAGFNPGPAPIGGSDWMAQQGLTRPVEQSASSLAGETAALLAPFGVAAKAPEIARAMLQGGENLMAPATLSKEAGVFIGPGAKTWNAEKAAKAQQMAEQGVDARAIWPETGTWKAPDGAWRQEVSDNLATGIPADPNFPVGPNGGQFNTKYVLDHPALYKSYDDLGSMQTRISPNNYGGKDGAYFRPSDGSFERIEVGALPIGDKTPTMLHELQHAIQQREGWAKGGSPDDSSLMPFVRKMYADNVDAFSGESHELIKMAKHRAYQNLAGEAEARATQARIPLTPEQRLATFPADSYDVPLDQLIIRK